MKALVVDDSAVMRKVLTGALARVQIEDVDHAADGKEAVEATQRSEYDLILMDWNMPVMNGLDATIAIRGNGHKMPIVMVTTEAEKARVLEAIRNGATNYIIKPFEPDAFVKKVKAILEEAAAKQ
jgi:two-component system chemotaxis response regulator CheY